MNIYMVYNMDNNTRQFAIHSRVTKDTIFFAVEKDTIDDIKKGIILTVSRKMGKNFLYLKLGQTKIRRMFENIAFLLKYSAPL